MKVASTVLNGRLEKRFSGRPLTRLEQQMVAMGLKIIIQGMEASLTENNHDNADVLSTATTAYQQGKITKNQLMAVINALDEQTYQTRAEAELKQPAGNSWNQEYLEATKYLDRYRR